MKTANTHWNTDTRKKMEPIKRSQLQSGIIYNLYSTRSLKNEPFFEKITQQVIGIGLLEEPNLRSHSWLVIYNTLCVNQNDGF